MANSAPQAHPRARAHLGLGCALLAFFAVGLGASPPGPGPARGGGADEVAVITPQLLMFRRAEHGHIEPLADGTNAQMGDLVQAAYLTAENLHGVIVSFDGNGVVTLHHPDEAHESTRLEPHTMVPLDHSFELDDAPGFERFVLVTSRDRDIDVSAVLQAATLLAGEGSGAQTRPLALPSKWIQTSLALRKPPR